MADEALPSNRGYVWAELEATYGADPTLAVADVMYVENWESNAKRLMVERDGQSHAPGGFPPVKVGQENTWSCDVEMATATIVDANDQPVIEDWYTCCGFTKESWQTNLGDGNSAQRYTLAISDAATNSSIAIEERFFDELDADGVGFQYLGCRADWEIRIKANERWMLHMDGMAKTGTSIATPNSTTATYDFDEPAVGCNTSIRLVEYLTDTVYEGQIIEATIKGNTGLTAQHGMSGSAGGPAEIRHIRTKDIILDLLVEMVADGDWDPPTMMDSLTGQGTGMSCAILTTNGTDPNAHSLALATSVSATSVLTGFGVSLLEVEPIAENEGRRVWRFTCVGRYPEVGTDEGGLAAALNFRIIYVNTAGATLT